jgi:hypothetical protein
MTDTARRVAVATNRAVMMRNYRRARDRALARLSKQFPEQYQELLEEERELDEQEGRKWLDISGATRYVDIRTNSSNTRTEAFYQGSNAGDNGGEA